MRASRVFVAFALGLAHACARPPTEPRLSAIVIKPATTLTLPEFTITFVEVESDSRCPIDAACIWSGNARVAITVQAPNTRYLAAKQFVNTDVEPRSIDVVGYRIRLDSLKPLPHAGQPIPQQDYVAYFSALRIPAQG